MKRIKKVISILVLQTFLFSSTGIASTEIKTNAPEAEGLKACVSIDDLAIPKEIGTVKNKHKGENGDLVIHIQDAHCNYEAQSNIAKILEHLIRNYNIELVAVEGADGVVDTSWFKAFPDTEIRKEVADYFMKKGEITGTEFLSITTDYPFTIYGAENRQYYVKNLNSFLESYPYKQEFQNYYTNTKTALAKLKSYIYTKDLIELDKDITLHKDGEIKFADYAKYLQGAAESKGVDLKNYENFKILTETLRYEKDINFDTVNEERAKLIDELSKSLSKDALSALVAESLEFKLGKIDGNKFYSYLAELANQNKIGLSEKYNNLARYIIYQRVYSKIDNEKLFDEIDLLTNALKEKMFKNEDQRTLNKLWTNVNVILDFMDIELTNKEYEYYLANKEEFNPAKFIDFIQAKSAAFGLTYNIEDVPQELSYIFPKLADFYEIALKRDEILINNMFKGMKGKHTNAAVLITGGFHTKGISKLLAEKNVSYVVVSPAITKESQSPYISVLTGQKTPFEELLAKTDKANKASELATPYLCDGDILEGIERRIPQLARSLARDIVDKRRKNMEEYAALFMHAYIARHPDTPYTPPTNSALYENMLRHFDELCKGHAQDANVKAIKNLIKSPEKFDLIYRSDKNINGLKQVISNKLNGQALTHERQFSSVLGILWEHAPLLAVKLELLSGFVKEDELDKIHKAIEAVESQAAEQAVLGLAFFPPDRKGVQTGGGREFREGAGLVNPQELIKQAKREYADIYGENRINDGFQRSVERLGGEEAHAFAILNETEPVFKPCVALALAFGKGDIFRFWERMTPVQKAHLLEELYTLAITEVKPFSSVSIVLAEKFYKRFITDNEEGAYVDVTKHKIGSPMAKDARKKDEEYQKALTLGEKAFVKGEVAFLELAGGKGGRLGEPLPKFMLKASQVQNKSLGRMKAEAIRALAEKYGRPIPWLIMTSDDTHAAIERFLTQHKETINGREYYFGEVPVEWVRLEKQVSIPQMTSSGEYLLDSTGMAETLKDKNPAKGMYEIVMGGFGHGDARDYVLRNNKGVQEWLAGFGVEYVCQLNVDNAFLPDVACFGWHIMSGKDVKPGEEHMSLVAVEKTNPTEKVGMAVLLDGQHAFIEYMHVPPAVVYYVYTYEIDSERFLIYRDDNGNITLRSQEDIAEFFRKHFTEEEAEGQLRKGLKIGNTFYYQHSEKDKNLFGLWITSHFLKIENIPYKNADGSRYKLPTYRGTDYSRDTLEQFAHLWLRLGNTNQLIWSLKTLNDPNNSLSDLPVVVQKNKEVDGFIAGTDEHHTRKDKALKAHKFERMAFHGFFGNTVKGAYVIVDRVGGFAPIKNAISAGEDTAETAARLFDENDKGILRNRKSWTISDNAIIELSPMFKNSLDDNIAENGIIEGEENAKTQLYLSGKDTVIGRGFKAESGILVRIRIDNEHTPYAKIRIGENVTTRADFTVTLEGNGGLVVEDGAVIDKPIDVVLVDGQRLYVKRDGTTELSNLELDEYFSGGKKINWAEWRRVDERTIENKEVKGMLATRNPNGTWDISGGGLPAGVETMLERATGLEKEMYQTVVDKTPDVIKDNPLVDLSQKGETKVTFTRENLGDFIEQEQAEVICVEIVKKINTDKGGIKFTKDTLMSKYGILPEKANTLLAKLNSGSHDVRALAALIASTKGMNLKSWFEKYKSEASVSTAGIRGVQNILFPQDPRELIGQKAIILATVAKALVAQELKAKGYPQREIHKLASSEVRYNSKEYVEFIARIQAALGITTHLPVNRETIPIWMASFLIFKYDLYGGEYVTSSHAISKKTATKDLNDQGSQYITDESKLFVDKIEEILGTIKREGSFTVTFAPADDVLIDEKFMERIDNGIDGYVQYLRRGIATEQNLSLIRTAGRKIYIDVVGGCMYRTMRKVFEGLGILAKFGWLHTEEDPYFHGIGKSCYRLKDGKLTLEDLSCDTSIIAIHSREDVEAITNDAIFAEEVKAKISEKAIGTQILISVPKSNSKIFGQIRARKDLSELNRLGVEYNSIELNSEKVLVLEIERRILPVIRTMGYEQKLKDAPLGTVIELTDPDGDRLITAEITSIKKRSLLEKLGIAYEILDETRILAVFMPNQSFLMTFDFRAKMLQEAGQWEDRNWFMIKTTASAASWDDWAAAQKGKSYMIKYFGTNNWVEVEGVPVVNVPVGFKEIASIMRKVEKQISETPDRPVIIEDIFGNQINLGIQPRLLFAGEESGGEIFGPTELIKSVNGREAIAMREKSAGEAMIITSAIAAHLERNDTSLVEYLNEIFQANNIVNRYDYREDVIYFNESEPDINVRKLAEKEGLKMKDENDLFYLAIAIAIREGKITFEEAKVFLRRTFPKVDFNNLQAIHFVGDGVYLKFTDRIVEIRPSGTEAKTKGYALGKTPAVLITNAKVLSGYYHPQMIEALRELLGPETHAEYFKPATYMGSEKPAIKVKALTLLDEYHARGAETAPFIPPANYGYLHGLLIEELPTLQSVLEEFRQNSGLPVSVTDVVEPQTAGRAPSEVWSEAFSTVRFDEDIYRRVERVVEDKEGNPLPGDERKTGKLNFANAEEDTDITPIEIYKKDDPRFPGIVREGEKMRQVLMDENAAVTPEAYFMYRGPFRSKADIQKAFRDNKVRYDITIIPPAKWGSELAKTYGHYHNPVKMPEVYQVLSGEAIYFMQKEGANGEIEDAIAVRAKAGDIVIMLPGYGHVSTNASSTKPLIMANWLTWNQTSYYGAFEKKRGGVAYFTRDASGKITMLPNANYTEVVKPRQMKPIGEPAPGFARGNPIYDLVNRGDFSALVDFLNNPDKYNEQLIPEKTLVPADEGELIPAKFFDTLGRIRKAEEKPFESGTGKNPEFLGFIDGRVIEKYTLPMEATVVSEPVAGTPQTLHVADGEVTITDSETSEIAELQKAAFDEGMTRFTMTAATSPATVYAEYAPGPAEGLVLGVPDRLKHFAGRLKGEEVQYACPQALLKERERGQIEEFLSRNLGVKAKVIPFAEGIGFADLKGKVDFNKPLVLIGTESNFGNIDTNDDFQKALFENAVKLPALPDSVTTDRGTKADYQFFNIEMFGAGFALAATGADIRDGKTINEDIAELQNLVGQFTGRPLTANEIYCLLPYGAVRDSGMLPQDVVTIRDVANVIKGLLMRVPARPMIQELRDRLIERRGIEWSV